MEIVTRSGERVLGVIGKKPIHLMSSDDRKHTLKLNQLWIDTGLDVDEVKLNISVGDTVVLMPNLQWLGKNRISGRGLDNKLGVYAIIKVIKQLAQEHTLPNTIIGVATVQEEVGSRGAAVAGYRIKPDIAVTVDLDFATDASLRAALKGMHGDKTIFIVSQRTSSIQFADNIIVLDDGQMVGFGPHEKLLETCETYKEIYDSQFKKESDMTKQKEV